jgi:tRNA-modifying protein YgfZ
VSGGYDALRGGAGLVDLDRALVSVTGPDAVSYLQSLVSADLDPVGDGQGAHSLLLTPQGKLDVEFRLLRVGDECWLDADTGLGPQLAESLVRFKIRVQVEVEDRSDTWGLFAVKGPSADEAVRAAGGVDVPAAAYAHAGWADARVVRADWPGVPGIDIVGPRPALAAHRDALLGAGAVVVEEDDYEAARVEAGVPRQTRDLDDRTIPQEAFLDRDAVSFTKGCFLGQELVTRIDTRGHVNRYLRGVRLGAPAEPGVEVVSDGKPVGALTSVAVSPALGPIALAFVRREVEPPADVTVAGAAATVQELPLVP